MDPLTEIEIFKQFKLIADGKTAFFISHRMAVGRIDKILVLKNGKLIESGSYEELMMKNGEYAKMYKTQSNWAVGDEYYQAMAGV